MEQLSQDNQTQGKAIQKILAILEDSQPSSGALTVDFPKLPITTNEELSNVEEYLKNDENEDKFVRTKTLIVFVTS